MSFIAIAWFASLAIGVLAFLAIRSTLRAFVVSSVAAFIFIGMAALYLGHPVAGVSAGSIAIATLVTSAAVAALRMATRYVKGRPNA